MVDPPTQNPESIFARWWKEHSEIDQLVIEVDMALRTGEGVLSALNDLDEALRSHLTIEEDIYFPLLERLLPEMSDGVRAARLVHRTIRQQLDDLRVQMTGSDLRGAREKFAELLGTFRDHEWAEESMVAQLRKGSY